MELNLTQKRFLIFPLCILVRGLIVYISTLNYTTAVLVSVLYIILIMGLIKLLIYGDTRKKGVIGEEIWWGYLRLVHVVLWSIFVILLLMGYYKYAWIVIVIDTVISIIGWLNQQYKLDNFSKLIE